MALEVDSIPATGTDYVVTNIEDGIALADDEVRRALAVAMPSRERGSRGGVRS
jgi:citrate lyase beta subunit